jgi:hypothetical protein
MHVPPGKLATSTVIAALMGAIACLSSLACSSRDPDHLGRLTVAFSTSTGIVVDTVSFAVTSSEGTTLASGTIDTRDVSGTVSIATGVAPSVGDTAQLSGIARDGSLCAGTSALFDVRAGVPVNVQIQLVCQPVADQASDVGSVVVNASVMAGNNCPTLTGWVVSPLQISPLGAITAAVGATDPDTQDHLTYTWTSSNGGVFTAPDGPLTLFACPPTVSPTGNTLSVVVSDNHVPVPCMAGVTVAVMCVASGDAGAD